MLYLIVHFTVAKCFNKRLPSISIDKDGGRSWYSFQWPKWSWIWKFSEQNEWKNILLAYVL